MWIPPQAQLAIFQGFPSPLSRPSILMSLWKFVLMVEFLMRPGELTGGLRAGVASHCPESVPRRGALPAVLDRGPLFTRPQPVPFTPAGEVPRVKRQARGHLLSPGQSLNPRLNTSRPLGPLQNVQRPPPPLPPALHSPQTSRRDPSWLCPFCSCLH